MRLEINRSEIIDVMNAVYEENVMKKMIFYCRWLSNNFDYCFEDDNLRIYNCSRKHPSIYELVKFETNIKINYRIIYFSDVAKVLR